MSGGSFDYAQYRLHDIAETIGEVVARHSKPIPEDEKDEYLRTEPYPKETLSALEATQDICRIMEVLLQRADWYIADDDGDDSYKRRTLEELKIARAESKTHAGKRVAEVCLDYLFTNAH